MEWQLEHAMSACVWEERRISPLDRSLVWHARQVSRDWRGVMSENARGMVREPPLASTCALPAPWQLSHPVRSGGCFPEAIDLKWGLRKKGCQRSAWQVLQASLPTKASCPKATQTNRKAPPSPFTFTFPLCWSG